MSIVVTGATGQLGRHVIAALLEQGTPADTIVAAGRSKEKLTDIAAQGVRTVVMDYQDRPSVAAALQGATKVLLISSSEVGQRVEQHRTVIEAAKAEGVELFVYTSIINADTTEMNLAAEHQATEALLKESGLPVTLLRNGWYFENYTAQLQGTLDQGSLAGSAGSGRVSGASRADYASAAAAVLLAEDQAGKVYELGGDESFTLAELAAVISETAGKNIAYSDFPSDQYAELLISAGLPEGLVSFLTDIDLGIARGDLQATGTDLRELIGRPTTPLSAAVLSAATPV